VCGDTCGVLVTQVIKEKQQLNPKQEGKGWNRPDLCGWKDHDAQEGSELGFSKNQQQLNPKQEPNFTQQLAIREYY
jgi:hypothetical protein